MKILVSGFEAFGGDSLNPTHLLIDELRAGDLAMPANAQVEGVLLPVGFSNAFDVLRSKIETFEPDVVVSLGLAGGRSAVEFERVAVNMMDADIADNNGWQPRDESISPKGLAAYFSTLPIRDLSNALKAENIPARISNTAGLYVCNFLFYKLQEYFARSAPQVKSGFVHVPYLPEQVAGKPGQPSMSFATMSRALEIILATLAAVP